MRIILFYLCLVVFLVGPSYAQTLPYDTISHNTATLSGGSGNIDPTGKQWSRVVNQAFGTLLGSAGNPTALGNYASFDPVNGAFTFKGTVALGNKDSKRMSFLSVSANGDLISNSYAALFSNTKLNTSSGIQLEYNFRLSSGNNFSIIRSNEARFNFDVWAATDSNIISRNQYIKDLNALNEKIDAINGQIFAGERELKDLKTQISIAKTNLESKKTDAKATLADIKSAAESLDKLLNDRFKLEKNVTKLHYKSDSLSNVRRISDDLKDWNTQKQYDKLENRKDKLYETAELAGVKFSYLTLLLGGGNKSYYTYYKNLPFSSQLTKNNLTTYRLGFVWNSYSADNLNKTAWFINFGALYERTNNADLLTTSEVVQEFAAKNTAGDTVRKVTKKYNAYTDSVVNKRQFRFYINTYYMFGSRTNGIHIFPSYQISNGKRGYLNTGVGFLTSFINQKKDQPVINFEAYIEFRDIPNVDKAASKFINRNEIGIRFTLPFTSFLK